MCVLISVPNMVFAVKVLHQVLGVIELLLSVAIAPQQLQLGAISRWSGPRDRQELFTKASAVSKAQGNIEETTECQPLVANVLVG